MANSKDEFKPSDFRYIIVRDDGTNAEEFLRLFTPPEEWTIIFDRVTMGGVHYILRKGKIENKTAQHPGHATIIAPEDLHLPPGTRRS